MKSDQYVARDFPEGWVECPVGRVTLSVIKIDPKKEPDREIDYIDISGIDNSRHVIGNVKQYRIKEAPSRARQVVRSGDVLFATVRPYLRNIASVPRKYDEQIASTGFSVLRPATGICPAFLFYKAISNDFVNALTEIQYGVSYPAVKDEQVREQLLGIPPSPEQLRIVAKIDELFSELDKGVESLETARAQLKVYRQAVLKHAFEGKLTAQWREENKDKLETAEKLLARIRRERDAHYEQQLRDWKVAIKNWEEKDRQGKKPPKPRKFRETENIRSDEVDGLPSIPGNWRMVRLCQIAQIGTGMSVSAARILEDPIDVSYLRVANVQRGFLDLSTVKTMTIEKSQLDRLRLKKWDVLFNEGGDRDKLGRGWIWQSQVAPCITQNHVFRASSFMASEFSSKLISYWANAFGQQYFEKKGKQTTNLASINKTVLSHFPVPLIPPEEQEELCKQIDKFMTILDTLEWETTIAFRVAWLLRQSILKEAFSGELVEQDPSDEPAAVLLERIKAEKASQKPRAKTRQRKAANA